MKHHPKQVDDGHQQKCAAKDVALWYEVAQGQEVDDKPKDKGDPYGRWHKATTQRHHHEGRGHHHHQSRNDHLNHRFAENV